MVLTPVETGMDGNSQLTATDIDLASCRRILVVKLDFIGDWVLCTPFLRNLRRSAPQAHITAIVLQRVRDLAATCPDIDRVVALRESLPAVPLLTPGDAAALRSFIDDYRQGAFDLAVVPRWDADFWGAASIAAASGGRWVVGFSERCTGRKQRLNRGHDRLFTHLLDRRQPTHEVEHNLALLRFMGGEVTVRDADLRLASADEAAADGFVREVFGSAGCDVVALAPFASEPKRNLPGRRLVRLARALRAKFGCRFAIIGGPAHVARAAELAAEIGGAASACGRLSLRGAAALIRRSVALVGADSAPAHVAAAFGTPVAVASCHPANGRPSHANSPLRFAPWGEPACIRVVQPERAAMPCRDACHSARPHCILNIPEGRLLHETIGLLERAMGRLRPSRRGAAAQPSDIEAAFPA
ncbi:MAG: glycosyltransferase family 9 protein [Alphaproteobacteria bacterium]|nr:MAG: glycosyltransferase family 9 protein [Alphaproteobacteria bacterium]